MAAIILIISYSARSDNNEVIVPAPAMIGKAKGTTEATSGGSSVNSVIPKIISSAINKITRDPATENEFTSRPISDKICSPINNYSKQNHTCSKNFFRYKHWVNFLQM